MKKHVSIARAFKEKSRLVGRINILTDVINHRNSLAEGSTRCIDHHVTPTPDDLLRADGRRTSNTRRRSRGAESRETPKENEDVRVLRIKTKRSWL